MSSRKLVYVKGPVHGAYRSRVLLDYFCSTPKYAIVFIDSNYSATPNSSLLTRLVFIIYRLMDSVFNSFKLCFSDVIFVLPMGRLSILEVLCARLLRKKVVVEFYISWYDTLVNDRKTVKPISYKAKSVLFDDRSLVDLSTALIFLNSSERSYYLDIINRKSSVSKSFVIPLITDKRETSRLPYANNYSQTITLCWWGTFIPLHGLEKIVNAAKVLRDRSVDFKLYLFGTSDEKSKPYQLMIDDLGVQDYVFIDNTKRFADQSLSDFLTQYCDVAFGNFGDSRKAKTVMVNKVVEAASMGLPVISQRTLALEEFFQDGESIIFSESTPEAIAEKVIQLSKDKLALTRVAESGLNIFESHFTKEAYVKEVESILEKVLSNN